jgi:hypothetical protein
MGNGKKIITMLGHYTGTVNDLAVKIPFKQDALLWLDGSITFRGGNYYFTDKSGNNKDFLITNYDFSDNWTGAFAYKTMSTISAPANDTALIAADVNNFFYTGGVPNQIPVQSFFQNVDYANRLFTRHSTQVLDGNNVEMFEPRVSDMVLYANVKTGVYLTTCNGYYNVPAKLGSGFREVGVGKTYATINAAITAASTNDIIYIYSGNYVENINISKSITIKGVGNVVISPTASQTYALQWTGANVTIKGLHIKTNGSTYGIYTGNSVSPTIDFCYIEKATTRSVWLRASTKAIIKNSIVHGGIFYHFSDYDIIGCRLGFNVTVTESLLAPQFYQVNTFTSNVKYCKIVYTLSAGNSALFQISALNFNFFNNTIKAINFNGLLAPYDASVKIYVNYNKVVTNQLYAGNASFVGGPSLRVCTNNYFKTVNGVGSGIYIIGTSGDVLISNNYIDLYQGWGANITQVNNVANTVTFTNNTCLMRNWTDNGTPNVIFGTMGGTVAENSNVVCNNNILLGPLYFNPLATWGGHTPLFFLNQKNVIAKYNYLAGCQVSDVVIKSAVSTNGLDMSNSIFAYNIGASNAMIIKGISYLKAYNNTFVNKYPGNYVLQLIHSDNDSNDPGNDLRNNIFVNMDNNVMISSNTAVNTVTLHNNLWYSPFGFTSVLYGNTYTSFASWAASGNETNPLNQNPNLMPGFYPSSKIASGENLGATYNEGLGIATNWGGLITIPTIVNQTQTTPWQIGAFIQA